MNIATPEELALSAKFKKLEAEYNKLRDEVESYFFPKIQECVSAGRFDDALLIAHRCPDELSRVFCLDAIRQARLKRG